MAQAARAAVGDVFAAAAFQAVEDAAQVARVGGDGGRAGFAQLQVVPVGPDVGHGRPGEQAADDGVGHAHRQGLGDVEAGDGKADEGLDGDEEGGVAVFVGAEEEEQGHAGGQYHQFGFERLGEVGQQGADEYARQCAGDALFQTALGGGVVGLADEYGGQQYPVAEVQLQGFHYEAAEEHQYRHADGVAEGGGFGGELAADAFEGVFQFGRIVVGDAQVAALFFGQPAFEVGKLVVDALQVGGQPLQLRQFGRVAVAFGIMCHRLPQAFARPCQTRVVFINPAVFQAVGDVAAGLCLQFHQAQEAENQVAVFQFVRRFAVVYVAGTGAFVDVLGGEVIAQHTGGARMAVLAAYAVEQRAAAEVEGVDDAAVFHGQVDLTLLQAVCFVGVEKNGFGIEVRTQCGIGFGHGFLHRAVRQQDVQQQGNRVVERRAAQNHQRIDVPGGGVGGVVGQRGVHRHGQRAEGDGAVAQADRANHSENEGQQGHHRQKHPGPPQRGLHRQRGHGKGRQRYRRIFQTA